jgi:hypothetical protein
MKGVKNFVTRGVTSCIAHIQSDYAHTQVSCGIELIRSPIIITPKRFYPHELQVNGEIRILQIKS